MKVSEIKRAMDDYASELTTERQAVLTSFTRIANAQSNMRAIEDKWTDETAGTTIDDEIEAIEDATLKAQYTAELSSMRAEKEEYVTMLETLDAAVTAGGLMLI